MEHEGKRFSLVYLERAAPARDSQRFRNRLAAYYWEHLHGDHKEPIRKALEREAGIEVPFIGNWGYSVSDVFKKGELRDLLDAITIVYQELIRQGWRGRADGWKAFVGKSLREENVGYTVDEKCGVHYFVDEEFERNRAATLSVLDHPKYAGVRAALEDAYRHLDSDPLDTKAAVRSVFEALEILVKQIVETKNLNKWIVENTLKTRCLTLYQADPVGTKVLAGLFDSLALWVDALHNYRHGQLAEEPVAPDESLCIQILSAGTSYVRWLAELHDRLRAEGET
jgi:hypothetical protein